MASSAADPAPLARAAIRRSYPRWEPSALDAHAGICAGGCPRRCGRMSRPDRRAVPTATACAVLWAGIWPLVWTLLACCGLFWARRTSDVVATLALVLLRFCPKWVVGLWQRVCQGDCCSPWRAGVHVSSIGRGLPRRARPGAPSCCGKPWAQGGVEGLRAVGEAGGLVRAAGSPAGRDPTAGGGAVVGLALRA